MKNNNYLMHFFLLFTLLFSHQLMALDESLDLENDLFSISGFGSIFATHAGNDDLGFYREFITYPQYKDWALSTDSNFGLQIDTEINSQFNATFQIVAKDRVKNSFKESIEWANLKYQPTENIALRAGRMGLDVHMLSEYRDVGFAYLWVRPIIEFYTPLIYTHLDGIDIAFNHQLHSGFIQLKLFTGQSYADFLDIEDTDDSSYVLSESDAYGATLSFEVEHWKFRSSYAKLKVTNVDAGSLQTLSNALDDNIVKLAWPDARNIAEVIKPIGRHLTYYSLGFAYDGEFQVQSEVSYIKSEWELVPSSYSAYVSLAKSFGEVTPFIVLSAKKMKNDTYKVVAPPPLPPLQELHKGIQGAFNKAQREQQTVSLGFRWDLEANISLKAQWDHTKIDYKAAGLWRDKNYPTNKDSMDTFSMGLNFIF